MNELAYLERYTDSFVQEVINGFSQASEHLENLYPTECDSPDCDVCKTCNEILEIGKTFFGALINERYLKLLSSEDNASKNTQKSKKVKLITIIELRCGVEDQDGNAMDEMKEILELWFHRKFQGYKEGFNNDSAIIFDEYDNDFREVRIDIRKLEHKKIEEDFSKEITEASNEMKHRPNGEAFHVAQQSFDALSSTLAPISEVKVVDPPTQ